MFFCSSRRRHTRCALVTGVQRVLFRSPDPGFRIDGFADRTQQAQAGKIVALRMRAGIGLRGLDQGTYGGGGRIENTDLVPLDHFPEAAGIRLSGYALEHDLCKSRRQGSVGTLGMAGTPVYLGSAPDQPIAPSAEHPI